MVKKLKAILLFLVTLQLEILPIMGETALWNPDMGQLSIANEEDVQYEIIDVGGRKTARNLNNTQTPSTYLYVKLPDGKTLTGNVRLRLTYIGGAPGMAVLQAQTGDSTYTGTTRWVPRGSDGWKSRVGAAAATITIVDNGK